MSERLTILEAGADPFRCSSDVTLRVQRGAECVELVVPITSGGIAELQEALLRERPRPTKRVETEQDGQRVLLPDYGDTDYLAAVDAWNIRCMQRVIGIGVDVEMPGAEGPEERFRRLVQAGLTQAQMAQLQEAILGLSRLQREEERISFREGDPRPSYRP